MQEQVIPSKRYDAFIRLYTRYLLEPQPAPADSPVGVSKVITPVTQADDLLKQPKVNFNTKDLTASAGTYTSFFTVPAGKRWVILNISRAGSVGTTNVRLRNAAQGLVVTLVPLGTAAIDRQGRWVLDEKDTLGMNTSGDAGDTGIQLDIHYLEEDAF